MKKLLKVFLATALSFGLMGTSIYAEEDSSFVIHDFDELGNLHIDDTLSYEEALEYISESADYDFEDITAFKKQHLENLAINTFSTRSTVRYSTFRLPSKRYTVKGTFAEYKAVLEPRFLVGLSYQGNDPVPSHIVSVSNGHLYTGGGDTVSFRGTMTYKLEAGNSFYYLAYGDICGGGNTTWSIGASVGIGRSASVNASVSGTTSAKLNVSFDGRYYSASLGS